MLAHNINTFNDTVVRERLRQATHHYHLRLNHHPSLVGLVQPDLSLAHYRKLLLAYLNLYSCLEERISQFITRSSYAFDYASRRKLQWLEQDIAFFQDDPHASRPEILLPDIDHIGQLIGVLYTIEGSTLGGQLISRSLASSHGLTRDEGARFFNGYGDETCAMWDDYIRYAETIAEDDEQCIMAERAACQTFQLFERVIDDLGDTAQSRIAHE